MYQELESRYQELGSRDFGFSFLGGFGFRV